MPQSPSTENYSLGRGILKIGEWSGATPPTYPSSYTDVGNCPSFEVTVTEDRLDHFSSRTGLRLKDKSIVVETGYTLKFKLDEMSVVNMQMFLKATLQGSNVLLANTALNKEFALAFQSDNPVGPNELWQFWRCQLSPDGNFALIGEKEWQTLGFSGEGLADTVGHQTSPYFTVTYATTTSTSTTTTTTT